MSKAFGNVKAADGGLSGNDMENNSGGKDSPEEELRNLGLTEQEIEVVSLVAEGLSNKEISENNKRNKNKNMF